MKRADYKYHYQYRKAVLKRIEKLRKQGVKFNEIASEFNTEDVDTFSGWGKWHGQTVHRLHTELKAKQNETE